MGARNLMISKPQVGAGHIVTKKKRLKTKVDASPKVPLYVPELKITIMVTPGADTAPIIQRYKDQREWQRKALHC